MSVDADHEHWTRNVYPGYWSRASRAYGMDSYSAGLLKLIEERSPKTAFELAIGNGYPFAGTLSSKGIEVSGCDISAELVAELKKDYPAVHACVGSYDDDAVGGDARYDLVYCLRSTWYFPDLRRALEFMLRKTAPGGTLVLDIMNSESRWNRRLLARKYLLFPVTIAKNAVKRLWNAFQPGRWMTERVFGIREIMYAPGLVEGFLREKGLPYSRFNLRQIEELSGPGPRSNDFSEDQKLVFVVTNAPEA